MSQLGKAMAIEGKISSYRLEPFEQTVDVMGRLVPSAAGSDDGLQPLLDRLLSMETDDAVGYLWVGCELANRGRVVFGL